MSLSAPGTVVLCRLVCVTLAAFTAASCTSLPFRGSAAPAQSRDSLYWKAITHLDAANRSGSLDSATIFLDAYLADDSTQQRRQEALVLRQLARDSRQLARVESALRQIRADTAAPAPRAQANDADVRKRDEEALKEIQRLKEELAKANEELERIRKRLAAPKPPPQR